MRKTSVALYTSIIILTLTGIVYVIGDPLSRFLSYQGPILGGGLLGWYTIYTSTPKEKMVTFDDAEIPIMSLAMRRKAWIGFLVSALLIIPWLTPFAYSITLHYPVIYFLAFLSEFIGGFIAGYFIPSLKFVEKVIIFSLGFAADIFLIMLIYIFSVLFHVQQGVLLNDILVYIYSVKFLEGILFAFYIIKKVNAI
ncbi:MULTISPECIES: hypothetical protein [Acidianus]|uniref:DUF1404 domain-containing protein n=1 Tax=Candidatus Acidianus copahuensis TaxID=1160895 RepID=A0A031LSP7_9CREN|nr:MULTISPECIES: hypothetical protein [Acidianus]EZQ10846.1 hypothetical protein CM19_03160 [Candidatus Acidianus copahuensis]NON61234.1 hypothetical protein [Acidianus sp. RZ1]